MTHYAETVKRLRQADLAVFQAELARCEEVTAAMDSGIGRKDIARHLGVNVSKVAAWEAIHREAVQRHDVLDEMVRLAQEDGTYDSPEGFVETR